MKASSRYALPVDLIEFGQPDNVLEVRSPYRHDLIAEVEMWEAGHIEARLSHLSSLKKSWIDKQVPVFRRAEILLKVAGRLRAELDDFAKLIASEGGKPLRDAKVEVERAAVSFQLASEECCRLVGESVSFSATPAGLGHSGFVRPEPIGLVVAITAFNHPLNLVAHHFASAMAVGCPILLKPALETPLSALELEKLILDCGYPREFVSVVIANNTRCEKMACDARVGFVSFVGSAKVGWDLRRKVSDGTRISLEHGGIAPVIVTESADLVRAIPGLVRAGYYHAGQVCVSGQRYFVASARFEEFKDLFVEKVRELKTGDPLIFDTDCGPLIRDRDVTRVNDFVVDAKLKQGHLLSGGMPLEGQCFAPTVIASLPSQSLARLMHEEVFGPVVVVNSYSSFDEVISEANHPRWGFQGSIYTGDLGEAQFLADELDCGTVLINEHPAFRTDAMPFSGRRSSGLSTGGIRYLMRDMTENKLLIHVALT